MVLTNLHFLKKAIAQCVKFYVWCLSFSIMSQGSHMIECVSLVHFFLWLNDIPLYIHTMFSIFVHQLINESFSLFVYHKYLNICVYVFWGISKVFFLTVVVFCTPLAMWEVSHFSVFPLTPTSFFKKIIAS